MRSTVNTPSPSELELIRGSLFTLRRKCGKPTCRCADGQLHETPALSFSVEGTTKIITLRAGEADAVRPAVEAYRAARDELEARAADFEQVRAWLAAHRDAQR